jgi:hypothetical protein
VDGAGVPGPARGGLPLRDLKIAAPALQVP